MIVKDYIKAVIEIEFDKGDLITPDTVMDYIQHLIETKELYIEFYDRHHNSVEVKGL